VVGRASDFADGSRIIVDVGGHSVGIFRCGERFYALLNRCPHMGAELCKGDVVGLVESKRPGDVRLNSEKLYVACPWHGWEYDLETGQSWIDPARSRVRAYSVAMETGEAIEAGVTDGSLHTLDCEAGVVDTTLHRVEGRLVADVLPIEIQGDYVVLSLTRVGSRT
jgi:nitrite reductase/ring-hydroxylating ferredoxin subunit